MHNLHSKTVLHASASYALSKAHLLRPSRSSQRIAAVSGNHEQAISVKVNDPYMAAGARLQSLINGVGDGEDELYYNMLLEEDPANKLQVNAVLGAIVLTASSTICWLCGADPAGGASLSLHSLASGLIGAAAAIPLVTFKLGFWSSETKQEDDTISALHKALIDNSKPWLQGMDSSQLALHIVLDTLPILFLMFPAAQAGLTASFAWSSAAIGQSIGLDLPPEVGFGLSLFMTAVIAGAVRSTELMTDPEQVEVIGEAVANADRYYRLTASGGEGNQEEQARRAATAFKAVAVCWRQQEQQMTSLFVWLQLLDILYLGVLWYFTKDMTAPCVAALLANAVDYHSMWSQLRQQGKGKGHSGGGGGVGPNKQQRQQRDSSTLRE